MNRLACRVMVAVAGMAMLGMTATLAGAQTDPMLADVYFDRRLNKRSAPAP